MALTRTSKYFVLELHKTIPHSDEKEPLTEKWINLVELKKPDTK